MRGIGSKTLGMLHVAAMEDIVPSTCFGFQHPSTSNRMPLLIMAGFVEWVSLGKTCKITPKGIAFLRTQINL